MEMRNNNPFKDFFSLFVMEKLDDDFYSRLREEAIKHHESSGGHGFDHVDRVYRNALKISNSDVDLDIVKASALLHDIAREKESEGIVKCHAEEGSRMCIKILENLNFPKEKIKSVSYSIKVHRYSNGVFPETREAAVLQDADRLDALGAVTVGRIFEYGGKKGCSSYDPNEDPEAEYISGENHSSMAHFHRKILKILPEGFHTPKAREIAQGRYNFVKEFVDRYIKEWHGEL